MSEKSTQVHAKHGFARLKSQHLAAEAGGSLGSRVNLDCRVSSRAARTMYTVRPYLKKEKGKCHRKQDILEG